MATKLTAVLNSQQMKEDAYITWSPFQERRLTFYTEHGAAVLATNFAVAFMVTALLILFWMRGGEGPQVRRIRKACAIIIFGAVLVWPLVDKLVPKMAAVVEIMPTIKNYESHIKIINALDDKSDKQGNRFTPDIAWVRQQLGETSVFRRELHPDCQTNFFSGQPWHEEDSPGNYTLRQTAEGIEYVWYDIEGGEHAVPLFPKKE